MLPQEPVLVAMSAIRRDLYRFTT